jgi:multiple sugar transport system ATP-binding protein
VDGFLGAPRRTRLPVQRGEAVGLSVPGGRLPWPAHFMPGAGLVASVGVRPEHLREADAGAQFGLAGEVDTIEQLGDTCVAYVRLPGLAEPIALKASAANTHLRRGETVHLAVDAAQLLAFFAAGRLLNE